MRAGGSGNRYFHRNQQYSVVALTDSSGSIKERYSYNAYGTLGIYDSSDSPLATSNLENRYTYTGREWDEELDLYHFRARMHDSSTGRFCSRDPIGYRDGVNAYQNNFFLQELDPTGTLRITTAASNYQYPEIANCGTITPVIFHALKFERTETNCEGYFIQKVDVYCSAGTCGDCPTKVPAKPNVTFYEGFPVEVNNSTYDQGIMPWTEVTDMFQLPLPSRGPDRPSCMRHRSVGEVKFFCKWGGPGDTGIGDLETDPAWQRNREYLDNDCAVLHTPGTLLSTRDKPDFWDNADFFEGPEVHWANVEYECCPCVGDSYYRAETSPGPKDM